MTDNRLRRFASPIAVVCVAVAFGAPILSGVGPGPIAVAAARADETATIFHGVGTVTAVDAASGAITVNHGDIPGFMDAMEMAYKVRPPTLCDSLQKGDTIAFGVEGKTYTIVEIKKVAKP